MVTITIDGHGCVAMTQALVNWMSRVGINHHAFNRFHWPAGASKWAKGHFLVTRDTMRKLMTGDYGRTVTLKIEDDTLDGTAGSVSCDRMYMLPPTPIASVGVGGVSDTADGLYQLCLVDERYYWQYQYLAPTQDFNVTMAEDRTKLIDASQNGGAAHTWLTMVTELVGGIGLNIADDTTISLDPSSTGDDDPYDYLQQFDNKALFLDRVVATLGLVFAADWNPGQHQVRRYTITVPSQLNEEASGLVSPGASYSKDLLAGGMIYNIASAEGRKWFDATIPDSVTVIFPRQVDFDEEMDEANGDVPTIQQYYTPSGVNAGVPTGTTGRAGIDMRVYDNMWALGVGTPTNSVALLARAKYLSRRFYNRFKVVKIDALLRGIHNIGVWPGYVEWHVGVSGPTTKLKVSDDWYGYGGDKDVVAGFHNHRIVGLGSIQVGKTFDGSVFITDQRVASLNIDGRTGQYKVMQLGSSDEPKWDWVRAH